MVLNESVFQKNCELWAKFNPKEALLLSYFEREKLAFSEPTEEELALWFSQMDLEKVSALCIYGIGLGSYYDAIKSWLEKEPLRRLIFLEDDLNVMGHFLGTKKAEEILKHPQIQVLYFQNLKDQEAVLEVFYWNFAMTKILVVASLPYASYKRQLFEELREKITFDFAVKNALVEEYLKYGGPFFINFYQNMLDLPSASLGNKTFGSFYKVPAIICGAGPSLVKSLPLLDALRDKALIFAGGSALNALNAVGIQPHLGAGIDPNPAQYERLKSNQAYEVPFYYRNRMYHEAFKLIRGPRLYVTGCGGYDVSDWFEKKLNIHADFMDEGHNVINFCLQIACQLGCNPIFLAGMDLAFTEMKVYAPGIEDQERLDLTQALNEEDYDTRPILKRDIQDKPIYTLWKWVAEAEWIGHFAEEHPELTIINCTEGGLGFPGVPNEPLKEVLEHYLMRQYAIDDRLNAEIQNSVLSHVTLSKVVKLMQELDESLKHCDEHLQVLINEALLLKAKIEKEKLLPSSLQSGLAALAETELAEEPAYQYVLDIFNAVQTRILNRELQEGKSDSDWKYALKKLDLNIKRLTFLKNVSQFNREAIAYALKNKKIDDYQEELKALPSPVVETPLFSECHALRIPQPFQEGQWVDSEHVVVTLKEYGKPPREVRLEKDGVLDGQCLLYDLEGKLKAETFYLEGRLHGPSTCYSLEGRILSRSFFVEGKRQGESQWYYPTGVLYAVRHFQQGKLHGEQRYFFPDGRLKLLLNYNQGSLITTE